MQHPKTPLHCPDMLSYVYRLQKIIRDMKFTQLPSEDAELARDNIVEALAAVQERIEREFS